MSWPFCLGEMMSNFWSDALGVACCWVPQEDPSASTLKYYAVYNQAGKFWGAVVDEAQDNIDLALVFLNKMFAAVKYTLAVQQPISPLGQFPIWLFSETVPTELCDYQFKSLTADLTSVGYQTAQGCLHFTCGCPTCKPIQTQKKILWNLMQQDL